jgi:hypothetical protein
MRTRYHRGFGHGLLPGTDHDMNCIACKRERAEGIKPLIQGTDPSYCPMGLTGRQVAAIMGDRLAAFNTWMVGQTVSQCTGSEYQHNRGPCFEASETGDPRDDIRNRVPVTQHERYEDHTWLCDYAGGGEEVPTECADHPHGMIWYRCDVEAFLRGDPVTD